VPIPQEIVEIKTEDNKKVRLDKKQSDEFNKKAIEYYRQYVMEYLSDDGMVKEDKATIDDETGDNLFDTTIRGYWTDAKADAKVDIEDKIASEKK
jgi:hypothetical protein